MADDTTGDWPRGLEDARGWADPANPILPPPAPDTQAEARAARALAQTLPTYGDPSVKPVQYAEAYAMLVAVACARADFYGTLLAEQFQREGIQGIVGFRIGVDKDGGEHEIGEETRGLARLEAEERDRAAKLIERGVRLGLEAKRVDVMRSYGHTVVESLKQMVDQLGMDWDEPEIRRAAQRAIIAARTGLGFDVASPDRAGAALSDEERKRVTGGATP